ncbi:DUF4031 domain-containing protein [Variovorax sp. EL159]|uniref:DUF4031 domain-containing protein n=1 Tax=Variovorax sp. EL159 TaxID=1566270 RepID=UPI00088F6034|nr:DUF4031 domain-containing protein [Variovorax sp. EL159]SCX72795.1 Protein of unknown function [Variovorax sp. EL159]
MIYVDDAKVLKHGYAWFHLVADSIQELHEFAASIGLSARAFHRGARHPHYDVTANQRRRALQHGATAISARDAVRIGLQAALPARAIAAAPPQPCLFA